MGRMKSAETTRLVTWGVMLFCTSLAASLTFLNNWGLPFIPRALIVAGLLLISLAMFVVFMRLPTR
jgi:hypothetical protein